MGFFVLQLFIILALLSPWQYVPAVAVFRPMMILSAFGLVITGARLLLHKASVFTSQTFFLMAFLMATAFSVVLTGWFGGALRAFLSVSIPVTLYLLVSTNANTLARLRWVALTLTLVASYISICCILACELGIDRERYALVETVNASGDFILRAKALSFLADPNDLAQFLVACLPMTLLLRRAGSIARNIFLVAIPLALQLSCIYLTHSRGGLLGLLVLVFLAIRRYSSIGGVLMSAVSGMVILFFGFSGGRQISIHEGTGGGRIELWSSSLAIAKQHILFGVGYDRILEYQEQTSHNSYLLCFAETGIIGFFLWMMMLNATVWQTREVWRDNRISSEEKASLGLVLASVYSLLTTSMFLSRTYSLTLYLFIGLCVALVQSIRSRLPDAFPVWRNVWLLRTAISMFAILFASYIMIRLRH